MTKINPKIKTPETLCKIIAALHKEGKTVVFTNGVFDILHAGHIRYLHDARKKGDVLIVAINSDSSVRKIKGSRRPLVKELLRAEVLQALEDVTYVTFFSETTPLEIIMKLKPDILIKGADYAPGEIVGRDFVQSTGGKVITVPLYKGCSTTKMINIILSRYGKDKSEKKCAE